ncbi:uncharacterized protein LOC136755100 isoform X2 [Amia ocellicauda]|uniref:uncharacterized protein LOC136755100 isoform X2 n=1 Tax=Amia ocellicauda TaxID=2972642 RepID=UPI0034645122
MPDFWAPWGSMPALSTGAEVGCSLSPQTPRRPTGSQPTRTPADLVQQLPVSAGGLLTFQTYCSAVNWLSDSTVETKLRGLYQAMSCCVPLDKEALDRLLTELYPQDAPGDIRQLSGLILREVDTKNQGFIDEDQFTVWLRRLLPETLTSSLHFPALPSKIAVAHEQHRPQRGPIQTEDTTNVTENQLQLTAAEMSRRRRDWRLLANRLGFLEKDCQAFERKHPETENQVLEMLLQWHRRARRTGAARELGEALRASGNTDIDNQVFQLAF